MKTIRARLTLSVLCILTVSYMFISVGVFFALGNMYRYSEGNRLIQTAQRIAGVSAEVMGKTTYDKLPFAEMLEIIYQDDIDAYSKTAGYYIITVDKYNRVIFSSANAGKIITEKGYPTKYIENILRGGSIKATKAMSDYFGTEVITAAQPVVKNGEVIGAVICSLPTVALSRLRMSAVGTIALSTVPVVIISLIVAYGISLKITGPISKVSQAAKLIAGGDLSKRVDIRAYESEIGELAANFNEMATALENSDKIKNSFISDVSHELRTPMTSIIGFLQGISDGVIPEEEHKKYISICLEESRRLSRLVSRLLEITRMESNENELIMTSFNINEKIRSVVHRFEEAAINKKVSITANYEEAYKMVYADVDAIERVLVNLIDNAVKFTEESGKIIVETRKSGDKLAVIISNTGSGILPEDINSIWDKFYKGDKSRSSDKTGTGLGLYFVKKILGSHGEKVNVMCREHDGTTYTTFKFELKLSEKESA